MPVLKHKFKCGCEIDLIDGVPQILFNELNLECNKTWDLYASGKTNSVFQLDKYLGKHWSAKIKPKSILEAADLISAIRPGTLNAEDENGTSLTEVYASRKCSNWQPNNNDVVGKLFMETYGIILTQEQMMSLSMNIAGFNGSEANSLRKVVSKKKSDKLIEMRTKFINGCKTIGKINEIEANKVFDNIEAAGRYSFCKCICPTSLIETETEIKTIDELQVGEKIKSPNGFIEVLDKFETGEKDLVEIELEDGKIISCTLEHKFMCDDGKIRELWEIINGDHSIVTEN